MCGSKQTQEAHTAIICVLPRLWVNDERDTFIVHFTVLTYEVSSLKKYVV